MVNGLRVEEEPLLELCRQAGSIITYYYREGFETTTKEDRSPLTNADIASHNIIVETLMKRYPDIPVLSEESSHVPSEERLKWDWFWLVDPLDGTKEFIHRQDEFTINIALIHRGLCLFGIVHVPVYDLTYVGYRSKGSWKITGKGRKVPIKPSNWSAKSGKVKVGISRFHLDPYTKVFLENFRDECLPIVCGSALKFCYVADGSIDIYLRFGPTWEWDTAAGQGIVEAAGGAVFDLTGRDVYYNKPSLKNGPFIVTGSRERFMETSFWKWIQEKKIALHGL
ncbi:MAG: 3'(2'),5'-bisphosphate nucleotidase CysQ [Syntrophobacterales bacterium]|nr:3'(2'),5'-bisphosphate nucleotidase CysQ [Syntrophobacterales bacterium]